MSINYVMYLADDRRPAEVAEDLARELKASGAALDQTSEVAAVLLPHLWVGVTAVGYPIDQFVAEEHGFRPRARVHFRLDKEALEPSQDALLEVLSSLLRRTQDDAVLLREEENVALSRKGGALEVGEDAIWERGDRHQWIERHRRRRGTTVV